MTPEEPHWILAWAFFLKAFHKISQLLKELREPTEPQK
jgi:hypothetical protein